MDPSALENDIPPPQRSRMLDFRFTDPVRFLFEHMQGDSSKTTSAPKVSEEWAKDNSPGKVTQTLEKNALSPSLKGSFQDLYTNDNVFTRITPVSEKDKPEEPNDSLVGANTDAVDNNRNVSDHFPPVHTPTNERTSNLIGEEETKLPSVKRGTDDFKPLNDTNSKTNLTSLVHAAPKFDPVPNNLSRHRITNNTTATKRDEPTTKPPFLKPPPFTKRLAARALRRANKQTPPLPPPAMGRTPPHNSSIQAIVPGNKPPVGTNHASPEKHTPSASIVAGTAVAPAHPEQDHLKSAAPREEIKITDDHIQLVELCKKSDWNSVEVSLKQFSKAGLPSALADEVRIITSYYDAKHA